MVRQIQILRPYISARGLSPNVQVNWIESVKKILIFS